MPVFNVEADGKKFKIEAPDQETALAAFAQLLDEPAPSAQQSYDQSLDTYRQSQYPGMGDEEFNRLVAATPRLQPANLGDLAKNGMVFGFGDEIDSALEAAGSQIQNWMGNKDAPGFADAFAATQALQEARLNLGREQNGWMAPVAEIVPSLATLGPGRAAVEALVHGGRAAATQAPSLLRQMAVGAWTGVGLGGAAGFGNAEGAPTERLWGAAEGALLGGGVGAAFPALGRALGLGANAIGERLAGNRVARSIGFTPDAARFLQTRLAADDALSPAGMQRMAAAGPEAMLADAGPSARNTLDYAIQSSGRAGRIAREAIDERVARSNARAEQGMDQALGAPQGVYTAETALRTGSRPQVNAAYETAYSRPIDYAAPAGREIETLLQSVPGEAIRRANRLMQVSRDPASQQTMAEIADNGAVTFRTMPDVRQLDYITRALNEEARHGIGAGAMGGQTDIGRALTNLSRDMRQAVRTAVPEYGRALETAATPIGQREALQFGADGLWTMARDEVAATARAMSAPERAFARQGVRSRVDEVVANVRQMASDPNFDARELRKLLSEVSSPAARAKIASLFDDPADANALFGTLDEAMRSLELRASVADNSKTFQRQEMGRQVDDLTNPQGIIGSLGRGEPINAGKRAVQGVTGFTPERALEAKDAMLQDVVRALVARGPAATQIARALVELGNSRATTNQVAQALIRSGMISGPAAYQAGMRSGDMRQ